MAFFVIVVGDHITTGYLGVIGDHAVFVGNGVLLRLELVKG